MTTVVVSELNPEVFVSIKRVAGLPVLAKLCDWASRHESRYVCICNVHSVVTATQDAECGRVVREADMAGPRHRMARRWLG